MPPEKEVRTQSVHVAAIDSGEAVFGVRVFTRLPRAWMVRGAVLALRRCMKGAQQPQETARDIAIPLVEASNWVNALNNHQEINLESDAHAKAFLFVRNRKQHQWADAIQPDAEAGWVWRSIENFPEPEEGFDDVRGESQYRGALEGKPVVETLRLLERLVAKLDPTADLT